MYEFRADIMIDGFNPQHVKGLLKKVSYITDATIVEPVEEYRSVEKDFDNKDSVTIGFKFAVIFCLVRIPDSKWLKEKVERDILSYFNGAREIWCECYFNEPEPPHIDIHNVHPRQIQWNKNARARRTKEMEERKARNEKANQAWLKKIGEGA